MLGEGIESGCFVLHHMSVEVGRTAHGLARVADDDVQSVASPKQLRTECLDAGRVSEVESVDLESVTPFGEVFLLGVSGCRVPRKTGRHDQAGPAAQEFDACLVADLHATTREECDFASQVRELPPLPIVQFGAWSAELVVEVVHISEVLLADVAVLGL